MKTAKVPSLLLALALQVLPVTRVFLATSPATGSSFVIVSSWIAGLAALMGGYNAVSGASTSITSSGTATGTNGTAFSYRITTGPDTANTFSAVPLPTGLTCSTTTGRITGTPTQEGAFTVFLTASDNGKASRTVTKNLSLTILSGGSPTNPPSITTQPTSRTVTNGGTTTFTVVASGSPTLRYQWRTNGIAMTGATSSTLTLSGITTNQTGNYSVAITNNSGSITSSTAVLTVLVPPSITTQPSSQTVTEGGSASFDVTAAGTATLAYQWRRNGANVDGATAATLNLNPVTTNQAGTYTVLVSNAAGSITSAPVTLTVNSAPVAPTITTQPVSRTATVGSNTTFTVVAGGTSPFVYQWFFAGTNLDNATNSILALAAVTTNDAGAYTVFITNSVGSVTSNPAILTVIPPPVAPTIVTQPEGLTVTASSNAIFTVAADGTAPLLYQWRKNAGNLSGATNTTFTIASAQAANAGDYTVIVSNSGGAVTSVVATLTVNALPVSDNTRPILNVLLPSATFTRVLSNSVTISGTAQDNQNVATIEVQQGTNGFATATGTTNWTANLALVPGTNVFNVRATDASGNHSLTNARTVFFAVMTPLTLTTNGNGAVASLTNNQMLELGKSYTLKATPKPGNLFSNWIVGSEIVTGPALNFTMSSNLTVVANFVPNPFIRLKGAYSGLFHPMTSEPPHEQSGYFTLAVTDKGTYSGKLLLNGGALSISGAFGIDLAAQKRVVRRGTNDLYVSLQLSGGLDQVTGYVSNALWVSELFGYRAAFNSSTNPATNFLGNYTMLLSGSDDTATSPFGLGYSSIAVANSGLVTMKGALADGTAGAQKGALAANGQLPVYVNLYHGKGSLFGWLTFTNTATNDIPGLLLWTKKDGVLGNFYPDGFTNEVLTLASRYTPPAKGTAAVSFSNSVVVLEGGNLTGPATNDVFFSTLNKITVTSTKTSKLALAVTSSSGLLSGSFSHPETLKKITIKGVLLQKQDLGGGSFLGTNQSGSVFLGHPENAPVFTP